MLNSCCFDVINGHRIFNQFFKVRLGQDDSNRLMVLNSLNLMLPLFDIFEGLLLVARDADYEDVGALILHSAIFGEVIVTRRVVNL